MKEQGGFNPEQTKEQTTDLFGQIEVFSRDIAARVEGTVAPAAKRFMLAAALLGSAEAMAHEIKGQELYDGPEIALTHKGAVVKLEKQIALLEQKERRLLMEIKQDERRIDRLEDTQSQRMRQEMIRVDVDLAEAKRDLRHDERMLNLVQAEKAAKQDRLERHAEARADVRAMHEQTIDLRHIADEETEQLLASWNVDMTGNIMHIPVKDPTPKKHHMVITADSGIVDAAFYRGARNELHVVFEQTDHTYVTVDIKDGVYEEMYQSDERGNPFKRGKQPRRE